MLVNFSCTFVLFSISAKIGSFPLCGFVSWAAENISNEAFSFSGNVAAGGALDAAPADGAALGLDCPAEPESELPHPAAQITKAEPAVISHEIFLNSFIVIPFLSLRSKHKTE
jgi:hypothetical protein